MICSLDLRKVVRGYTFPALPLINPTDVGDFKQKRKAQTYIRVHRRAFGYNPTCIKVRIWLESQSRVYTHINSFLCVGSIPLM